VDHNRSSTGNAYNQMELDAKIDYF
jgi:hypothetical protein